jgi:hypothetical protein
VGLLAVSPNHVEGGGEKKVLVLVSLPTLWGEESFLGKKDGCISLPLRLRRLVGALTLVAVPEISGSVEGVPDADEGPSTVQVSHGSVDDCLVAVMHSVGVLRTYGVQWGHLGAVIDCVPMLWDSW